MNKNLIKFQYSIHQLKDVFSRNHGGISLEFYKEIHNGLEVNMNRYKQVYEAEAEMNVITDLQALEILFRTFNIEHPNDYKGKSLSVGDIVDLNGKLYFCDSIGFIEINPSFEKPTCTFDEYLIIKHGRSYHEIKEFLKDNDEIKGEFLQYCWNNHYEAIFNN